MRPALKSYNKEDLQEAVAKVNEVLERIQADHEDLGVEVDETNQCVFLVKPSGRALRYTEK